MAKEAGLILDATGIVNRFGRQVVHDGLDLRVAAGEIVALVGGSGSGKSVLLRTLTGLRTPNAGNVLINSRGKMVPVARLAPQERAATVGVLFQQGALFSGLTVLGNIMAPLREFTDWSEAKCRQVALERLQQAGLGAEAADKMPAELSGGMVKRVGLARAMALEPRILFLDEPTAGLDPIAAAEFDSLIERLNRELGLTIVMITHDLDSLYRLPDRIAVLVDKHIVAGTLQELLQSTHPWIHAYFHGERSRSLQAGRVTAGQAGTDKLKNQLGKRTTMRDPHGA